MILKHRDRELMRFDWVKPFGVKNVEPNAREMRWLPLEFPGLDRDRVRDRLARLRGFRLTRDARYNLPNASFRAASDFLSLRIDRLLEKHVGSVHEGGPVKIGFTGSGRLLQLVRDNPGLRRNALAKLSGLTERTTKRYLSQLKGQVFFKGAPKTGGYYDFGRKTNLHFK